MIPKERAGRPFDRFHRWFSSWKPKLDMVVFPPPLTEVAIETCTLKSEEGTVVIADPLLSGFCWIPRGYIVYSRGESGDPLVDSNLWRIPVSSQTGKPEAGPTRLSNWADSAISGLAASADGKRITFAKSSFRGQVYVGELEGGGTRMKPPQRLTWGALESIDWSHDGEVLYCGSVSPEAATLLRIDMEGQVQVLWRQKGATATWGVPSPDGRHLAVLGAIIDSNQWMVEGF